MQRMKRNAQQTIASNQPKVTVPLLQRCSSSIIPFFSPGCLPRHRNSGDFAAAAHKLCTQMHAWPPPCAGASPNCDFNHSAQRRWSRRRAARSSRSGAAGKGPSPRSLNRRKRPHDAGHASPPRSYACAPGICPPISRPSQPAIFAQAERLPATKIGRVLSFTRLQPCQALLRAQTDKQVVGVRGKGVFARQTCLLSDKNPTVPVSLERTMLMMMASFSRPGSPHVQVIIIARDHDSKQSFSLSAEHDGESAGRRCKSI